jgi:hypothetical protein
MANPEQGNLREAMPLVTAWIDDLRVAFGREVIDKAIKAGLRGEPRFWASENGITIGTKVFQGDGNG